MAKRLFVGNLPYSATQDEIREVFAAFGEVVEVDLRSDRETGRPKGYGFVEMTTEDQATAAVDGLNGSDMNGRKLTVNVARPREERPAVA